MAKQNYMGLQIDLSRDELFDNLGIQRLKESYMREDEESPQERFAFVSKSFALMMSMRKDYTNIAASIGYHIPLQFYLTDVPKKECRYLVF